AGLCAVGGQDLADRGPVPSRGLRHAERRGALVPVGRRAARRAARQLRLPALGPHPRHRHAAGRQRLRRLPARWQRMGVDDDTLSALSRLPTLPVLPRLLGALLRRRPLRAQGGLARADERLLRRHAPAILEHLPPPVVVAELGSGSGRKTRWLLETLARREPVNYYPIDISPAALAKCEQELAVLGAVSIVGLEKSYLDGLQHVAEQRRPGQTLLVLFLGSTVGNFDRAAAERFLREVRRSLLPGDALLLG